MTRPGPERVEYRSIRPAFPTMFRAVLCVVCLTLSGAAQGVAERLRQTLDAVADPEVRQALEERLRNEKSRIGHEAGASENETEKDALRERMNTIDSALSLIAPTPRATMPVDHDANHFFESKVRPILVESCHSCHGPEKQKSGLRLDSRSAVLAGGGRGPAVVPGDIENSPLVQAVRYLGEVQMPPDSKLSQDKIEALAEWVRLGAPWPDDQPGVAQSRGEIDIGAGRHWWSFKPVASTEPPAVRGEEWIKTPIDRFILAKLESNDLPPAPPADKRTLIRRASFDLIGLPPTPDEVAAYLADDSPNAFEKVIDRLLASPHYGERWGRHWLDVVRYTDSFDSRGSAATDPVNAWRYRDWVINAFNRDMPYDEFVRCQIAGDLMPDPADPDSGFNREGTIATAMLAIGNWPQGDADKEKMLTDIVDDQIDVVSRGFMGVTMGCARCHDHKFDPFTMQDYYGLAGIFFSSHIIPGPGQKTEGSPILHIPLISPSERAARDEREKRIGELVAEIKSLEDSLRAETVKTLVPDTAKYILAAWDLKSAQGKAAGLTPDHVARERGLNAEALGRWVNFLQLEPFRLLQRGTSAVQGISGLYALQGQNDTPSAVFNTSVNEAAFLTIKQPARSVSLHPSPNAAVAVAWQSVVSGSVSITGRVADADSVCGDGVSWKVESRRGESIADLASGGIENGGAADFGGSSSLDVTVEPGDYIVLSVLPKGGHACDTTVIELTVEETGGEMRRWCLAEDTLHGQQGPNPIGDGYGNPRVWYFADLSPAPAVAPDSVLAGWFEAANAPAPDRTALEREAQRVLRAVAVAETDLERAFRDEVLSERGPFWLDPLSVAASEKTEAHRQLVDARARLEQLRAEPLPPLEYTEGIQEGGVPDTEYAGIHDVRIHRRGSYTQLGDLVPRRFPLVLAADEQEPIKEGSGRLQLAQWVSSPENPLTARVMVNRIWQHHFGQGIVRTPGNFGKLGEPPTHPELLDWLAAEFIRSGWSVKAMHRVMMLSSTYQQSSGRIDSTQDADNRLFGRMNRRRLEAEPLRDAMLAVSGTLDATLGGPAFTDLATPRRTAYFRTVRSDRTSYTMLFDAADPTAIIDTRTESIVAPQALFLLNHSFVRQSAGALAAAVAREAPAAAADRIQWLYERLFARPANEPECRVGTELVNLAGNDLDAWRQYCQILLCANEFVFID